MTTQDEAAAALRASKAINQHQQHLTEESRVLLAAILRTEMRDAVSKGIENVMTDERFWERVFAVLQKQATERTGRFVWAGVTLVFKKAMLIGLFALMAYSIGGWTLLKAIWAGMTKGT
jgi:hypothetical protein